MPHKACGPCRWALNSNDVTTPKFPAPPRNAQNRSGLSSALASRSLPSAVTMSARDEVVCGEAELARGPTEARAHGEACHSRCRYDAARHDKSEGLGFVIDLAPRGARLDTNPSKKWIDPNATP